MITWQIVALVSVLSVVFSFLFIYVKEFGREQESINNYYKTMEEQRKLIKAEQELLKGGAPLVYVMPNAPAPKKKVSAETKPAVSSKDKKNFN